MQPLPNRWRILGLVGIAQLMLILDVTVVALALPSMGADLGMGREELTWVVSGYTLVFGGLLLLGGRIADVFGVRRVVLIGLTLFSLASLSAGLADSGATMLASRAAQGVGAALLSPAALSLVVTIFDGEERNRALGIWSALGGAGAALGVLLGGVLTAGPGWPWVFYVNVPVGVVIIAVLRVQLPQLPRPAVRGTVDVAGALLVTAATGVLIFALIRAGDAGWASAPTLVGVLAAVLLYGAFVARQRAAQTPLVRLSVIAQRPVAVGLALIATATAMLIVAFFLGTFYLQETQGHGALETGLMFLPVAVLSMAGANLAGQVLSKVGGRRLAPAGLVLAAAGMTLASLVGGTVALIVGVALVGAGTGVVFVVSAASALGQVAPEDAGVASGALSTFHEFGASFGAALASTVAAASFAAGGGGGYADGFAAAAAVALLVAVATAVALPRPTPAAAVS